MTKAVVFCVPTYTKPHQATLDAVEASVPLLEEHGWDCKSVFEVGCPYISHARATMLRKALNIDPEVIVFIDHDVSWSKEDMLKLISTEGDVVSGTYRFKKDDEEYMGQILTDDDGFPIMRDDGCIESFCVPAGFLKITPKAVSTFMKHYPELIYYQDDKRYNPSVDLFNHGAHEGVWYGEDYAFSRNWRNCGERIWLIPDLSLTHHDNDKSYPGNFHEYMLRQPGGSNEEAA